MADTWIKVEYSTLEKIEVAKTATALGMDPYTVVGRLIRIWAYFDVQSREGRIDGIDANFVDRMVQHPGFCAAIAAVGWMQIDAGGITLPNFDRHNGGGAKARALRAQRNERYRGRKKTPVSKKDATRDAPASHGASPEKRREDQKREDENTQMRGEQKNLLPFPEEVPADELCRAFGDRYAGPIPLRQDEATKFFAALADGGRSQLVADAIEDSTRDRTQTLLDFRNWFLCEKNANAKQLSPGEQQRIIDETRRKMAGGSA